MAASEDRAALHGKEERLFKLVSARATSEQWAEWLRAPLEHALADDDKDLASALLKAGANAGAGWEGCDGRTLLDAAAEGGNDDLVSTLLKAGGRADMDAVSGDKNMTALHRACKGGHTAVTRALMLEGADVSLIDSSGSTALHYALQGGHTEMAVDVVLSGADLNAAEINGDTPLHLAATRGYDNFVCTLLRKGASVDVANKTGQCALHMAVERSHIASAEALLEADADPDLGYGLAKMRFPLRLACCNVAMTEMLLKHGADVKASDDIGYTVLHWAGELGIPDVIDALVEAGADLEARSGAGCFFKRRYLFEGFTPLHTTTVNGKVESMAALLDKGADINAKDDNASTPLHVLCKTSAEHKQRAHATADFLLRRGADETITNDDGHTPEDLIESSADPTGCLQRLLANAPADRTWRRRGMLVMCRAFPEKMLGDVGNRRPGKASCQGQGIGAGVAAAAGGGGAGHGNERGSLVARVVEMDAEALFRTIVGFL